VSGQSLVPERPVWPLGTLLSLLRSLSLPTNLRPPGSHPGLYSKGSSGAHWLECNRASRACQRPFADRNPITFPQIRVCHFTTPEGGTCCSPKCRPSVSMAFRPPKSRPAPTSEGGIHYSPGCKSRGIRRPIKVPLLRPKQNTKPDPLTPGHGTEIRLVAKRSWIPAFAAMTKSLRGSRNVSQRNVPTIVNRTPICGAGKYPLEFGWPLW